jgi:predicted PhzF superfamily epimerase YddE/YHI9
MPISLQTLKRRRGWLRRFGLDTAFILRPEEPDADMPIRHFVPHHEMGVSGHATIGAVTVALSSQVVGSDHLEDSAIQWPFRVAWMRRGK